MYFEVLYNKLKAFSELNATHAVNKAFQQGEVRAYTVKLIRWEQLFIGLDGKSRELSSIGGDYTQFTINAKKALGLPTDIVTLFQYGDFYESIFVVTPDLNDPVIHIEADFMKDGTDLRSRWGDSLTDVNNESLEKLQEFIKPFIIQYILDTWNNA